MFIHFYYTNSWMTEIWNKLPIKYQSFFYRSWMLIIFFPLCLEVGSRQLSTFVQLHWFLLVKLPSTNKVTRLQGDSPATSCAPLKWCTHLFRCRLVDVVRLVSIAQSHRIHLTLSSINDLLLMLQKQLKCIYQIHVKTNLAKWLLTFELSCSVVNLLVW